MSNSLQLLELQNTSLLCPPLSPRVCSNSCPLSWWCYLTISSSAALFSFCLQSFPEAGSFPMSWLFASTGQSIRASTLASVLPMNNQGWFPLGLTGLISLLSKGLSESPWFQIPALEHTCKGIKLMGRLVYICEMFRIMAGTL